ncbi:uncharacterized protein LOC62_03G003935 [Vanrija pseudolonga]|uniref:Uncharacterized protein n=1 Tax=Vanrija pseudolonga TaxID=143232 RepID=A0AAF0Y6U1_9TREE|nr:hypothetical protein LOC62_03G003935 [Vanrija pseudolonga]
MCLPERVASHILMHVMVPALLDALWWYQIDAGVRAAPFRILSLPPELICHVLGLAADEPHLLSVDQVRRICRYVINARAMAGMSAALADGVEDRVRAEWLARGGMWWSAGDRTSPSTLPAVFFDPATDDNPLAPLLSLPEHSDNVRVKLGGMQRVRGLGGLAHPVLTIEWEWDDNEDRRVHAALNASRIAGMVLLYADSGETLFNFLDALAVPTLRHLDLRPWPDALADAGDMIYVSKLLTYLRIGRARLHTLVVPRHRKLVRYLALVLVQPAAGFTLENVCAGMCELVRAYPNDPEEVEWPAPSTYPLECFCEVTPTPSGEPVHIHLRTISQVMRRNAGLNARARAAALRMLVVGRVLFHASLACEDDSEADEDEEMAATTASSSASPRHAADSDDEPPHKRSKATHAPTPDAVSPSRLGELLLSLPAEVLEIVVSHTAPDDALTDEQRLRVLAHARDRRDLARVAATFAAVRRHRPESERRARDEWLANGGVGWDIRTTKQRKPDRLVIDNVFALRHED